MYTSDEQFKQNQKPMLLIMSDEGQDFTTMFEPNSLYLCRLFMQLKLVFLNAFIFAACFSVFN